MNVQCLTGRPIFGRSVAVLLLLLLAALLMTEARAVTTTADEPAYVAGGYALLARGPEALDMLAQRGYPPLMPLLDGLMVYVGTPDLPVASMPGWPNAFDLYARSFLESLPSFDRAVFVTRLPTIWLSILLAALVTRWATDLFSRPAGVVALIGHVLDPTLLAHGALATSDVGITFFGTAALYAAWRWLRRSDWRWSTALGMLLGLTLLAKVSGPIWAASAGAIMLGRLARTRGRSHRAPRLWQTLGAAGLALLILWAGYAFQLGTLGSTVLRVPVPAYWDSVRYLREYASVFYALGRRFTQAQWWYFPLAFAIKNPLPLLALWLSGIVRLVVHARARRSLALLLLFPAVYSAVALFEGMDIGYRHMLPIHPFLHILAGGGWALVRSSGPRRLRWALPLLIISLAAATLRTYPNELAFFSVLVGGPSEGYRYLVDSNLDWGQRTDRQETVLAEHPEWHTGSPETKLRPAPGRYVVGASELQGVGIGDPSTFEWFRHLAPTDDIDHGLLVYDVPTMVVGWIAQCGTPSLPLDDISLSEGFGSQPIRNVGFDCTRAWLYPEGGATSGVYAIGGDLIDGSACLTSGFRKDDVYASDEFLQRRLSSTRLSFCESRPFYALFEYVPSGAAAPGGADALAAQATQLPAAPLHDPVYAVQADQVPSRLERARPCMSGVREDTDGCSIDGPLAYLGMTVLQAEDVIEVETWWRVTAGPVTRNFSIMAHLITAEGELVGNADGLGVWPMVLQVGDIFAQRHRFTVPEAPQALWFRTGAYWLDTMALWSIDDGDALLVQLAAP